MALLLVLGPRVLPEYRDPDAGRLDLVSAACRWWRCWRWCSGSSRSPRTALARWPSPRPGGAGGRGGVRAPAAAPGRPDDRPAAVPDHVFSASLATNFLGIFVAVGYFLFVAQYLQLVLGLSPLEAGLWSLPSAVGFIVGSNLAPRILRRVRPACVIGAGLGMAAVGLGVLTQVGGSPDADLAILVGASLLVSLGLAPVFGSTTDLIVSSAPPERAGRPRGSRRPAPSSAARSASRSWAASAWPSTATSWPTPCRQASRPRPPRSRATPWAVRWASPASCPAEAGAALLVGGPRGVHPGDAADRHAQRRRRGRRRRHGHGPAPGGTSRCRGRARPAAGPRAGPRSPPPGTARAGAAARAGHPDHPLGFGLPRLPG